LKEDIEEEVDIGMLSPVPENWAQ